MPNKIENNTENDFFADFEDIFAYFYILSISKPTNSS